MSSMIMFITHIHYLLSNSYAQYKCHFINTSYLFFPLSEMAVIYDV